MKNKRCWFFGDSFTVNSQDKPENEYTRFLGNSFDTWSTIVSKELDCEEINFGKGGNSNQRIIFECYHNIPRMTSGDFCFIGSTTPIRIEGYDKFTGKIGVYNNESYRLDSWDGCFNLPIDTHQHSILIDYVHEFISKPLQAWEDYWNDKFIDLTLILMKLKITPFYWSYKTWSSHEYIATHTKGKVDDGHWSINGHRTFAKHVLGQLNIES